MDFLQAPTIHLRRLALIEKTTDLTTSGDLPWFPLASRATAVMWLPLTTPVVFQVRNRQLK